MSKLTLDRMLQSQGFGSRKWCRQLVEDGEVTVNGTLADDYRLVVDPHKLVFTVFGEEWIYRQHVYIALNKPVDIECSRKPSHHPGVLESAIIARPCPVLGERVHAFVARKGGAAVTAAELKNFCASRLADYKVPESFTLLEEPLPRNANGKLLKRVLRERLPAA